MIVPALALTLLGQQTKTAAPDYNVPVGASSEFHRLVIDIKEALSKKDFPTAQKLVNLLPRSSATYRVDTSKLDAVQKAEFPKAIETAADRWIQSSNRGFNFKPAEGKAKADIVFSFEPVLAKVAGSDQVAGATWFLGADSSQPSVEAVIGLKRGPKLEAVIGKEVFNESQFTFGRYLGLAPTPIFGSGMGRVEGQMGNLTNIGGDEVSVARRILALSSLLREAVQKKQSIASTQPALKLEREDLKFKDQFQGDQGQAQMLVTNNGDAPLQLAVRGDCGCINGSVALVLAPGKSTLLTGYYSTQELVGDVHHNLVLRTNDPNRPTIVIPAIINVIPRAEFVYPESNTVYMDQADKPFVFYVNSREANIFKVLDSGVIGAPFTLKIDKFEGEVANFLKQGKKEKVRGYKVAVDISELNAQLLFGRAMATVFLKTDNPKLGFAKSQLFIQKGIVSLPESLYLGSPAGIADTTLVLSRPGRPFNIKKISSPSKYLTFQTTPNSPTNASAYTIRVIYDGKAPGHKLKSEVVVETDDPKQPTFKLPIQTSQIL